MANAPQFFVRTDFGRYLRILYNGNRMTGLKFNKDFGTYVVAILEQYDAIEALTAQLDAEPAPGSELDRLYCTLREVIARYIDAAEEFLLIDSWSGHDPHMKAFLKIAAGWEDVRNDSPSVIIYDMTKATALCLREYHEELVAYARRTQPDNVVSQSRTLAGIGHLSAGPVARQWTPDPTCCAVPYASQFSL